MIKINNTLFEHPIIQEKVKTSKTIFKDSFLKVTYAYDKYNRIINVKIKIRKKIKYLIKESSLFLLEGESTNIQIVYSDKSIRIFRTEINKNYLISILI